MGFQRFTGGIRGERLWVSQMSRDANLGLHDSFLSSLDFLEVAMLPRTSNGQVDPSLMSPPPETNNVGEEEMVLASVDSYGRILGVRLGI
eukprot:1349698-Amorphochlora_amoeboformis.AAC.1